MDVVKEDMTEVEVTEEDTVDRNNWRRKIRCGDPWWEKPKEEEEEVGVAMGDSCSLVYRPLFECIGLYR